jgi:chemotaxis protein MotD
MTAAVSIGHAAAPAHKSGAAKHAAGHDAALGDFTKAVGLARHTSGHLEKPAGPGGRGDGDLRNVAQAGDDAPSAMHDAPPGADELQAITHAHKRETNPAVASEPLDEARPAPDLDQRKRRRPDDDAGATIPIPIRILTEPVAKAEISARGADGAPENVPEVSAGSQTQAKTTGEGTSAIQPTSDRAPATSGQTVAAAPPPISAVPAEPAGAPAPVVQQAPVEAETMPPRTGETTISAIISLLSAVGATATIETADDAPAAMPDAANAAPVAEPDVQSRSANANPQPIPLRPDAFRAELTVAAANYSVTSVSRSQLRSSAADNAATPVERETPAPVRVSLPAEPRYAPATTAAAPVAAQSPAVADRAPVDAAAPPPPAAANPAPANTASPAAPGTTEIKDGFDKGVSSMSDPATEADADAPLPAPKSVMPTAIDAPASPPAAPGPGAPATSVVAAIASAPSWRPATVAATTQLGRLQTARSATDLSIQLHPAELGMVTANLKLSGTQLSVELSAETSEAQDRLTTDSDTILKALRALGFDIDQVSVIQPTVNQTAATRTDAAASSPMTAPREQDAPGTNSSGGGGRSGSQQNGRNDNDTAPIPQSPAPGGADRTRGGVYI